MIPVMFNHFGQRRYRQRLAQHIVHSRVEVLFFVFQYVGSQRNQRRQRLPGIAFTQYPGDIQPGHIRQLDVQQHQIELVRIKHGQRILAVHRHFNAVTQFFQYRTRHNHIQLNIFHQQDMQRRQWQFLFNCGFTFHFLHRRCLDG
ncbi:hypothetical protein D3C80_1618960 [compost metagenome]